MRRTWHQCQSPCHPSAQKLKGKAPRRSQLLLPITLLPLHPEKKKRDAWRTTKHNIKIKAVISEAQFQFVVGMAINHQPVQRGTGNHSSKESSERPLIQGFPSKRVWFSTTYKPIPRALEKRGHNSRYPQVGESSKIELNIYIYIYIYIYVSIYIYICFRKRIAGLLEVSTGRREQFRWYCPSSIALLHPIALYIYIYICICLESPCPLKNGVITLNNGLMDLFVKGSWRLQVCVYIYIYMHNTPPFQFFSWGPVLVRHRHRPRFPFSKQMIRRGRALLRSAWSLRRAPLRGAGLDAALRTGPGYLDGLAVS